MKKPLSGWMLCIPMLIGLLSMGQTAMSQDTVISLETEKTALVMQLDVQKRLHYTYLGVKLDNRSDYGALPGVEQSVGDYTGMLQFCLYAFRIQELAGTGYHRYTCRW